jgi:hypothetical protein
MFFVIHIFTFVVKALSLCFFCLLVSLNLVTFKDIFVNIQKHLDNVIHTKLYYIMMHIYTSYVVINNYVLIVLN